MRTTKEWAESHGLSVADTVPPVDGYSEPYCRTAIEVASRAVVLHGVAAVGYGVDPGPVINWLKDQSLWHVVSRNEKDFLLSQNPPDDQRNFARWRQEAQWALLWALGKVSVLGLPTKTCDTKRLVDQIMPAFGDAVESFVAAAELRPPAELLGEDDRIYNLHCFARKAFREAGLPDDLIYPALFQRHYAFEWLSGEGGWDDVTTDT